MDWSNERYVRLYTRDTETVLLQSWQARALFREMLRKCDRAGVIECRTGLRGLSLVVGMPLDVVTAHLPELLADESVRECAEGYVLPNFLAAQDTPQSDAQRARESRQRRRDLAQRGVTKRDTGSVPAGADPATVTERDATITERDAPSRNVIEPSHGVTRSHAVSLLPSKPSIPVQPAVAVPSATTATEWGEALATGAIELAVAANRAIADRFGEQPDPILASSGRSHEVAEAVLSAGIPLDFAKSSIARQVQSSVSKPVRTLKYFLAGIQEDWAKHNERVAAAGADPVQPLERQGRERRPTATELVMAQLKREGVA